MYEPIPEFQLVPPTKDRPNNEYQTYLQSPRWQKLRRAVKLRAKGKCEICLRANGAHCAHITYERIFNERLTDLLWLCRRCHDYLDERAPAEFEVDSAA